MAQATATRIGSSPLRIDWTGISAQAHSGKKGAEFGPARSIEETWSELKTLFLKDEVGFYFSPTQDSLSQFSASKELAQSILRNGNISDVLFLGIGGSALGPICLLQSLEHLRKNSIRFHFAENPDPIDWTLTLSKLSPQSTLVVAVTKSGGTFETISQLLIALEWLGKDRWRNQLIAITDPKKGDLRQFSNDYGIRTLEISPSIGGRFSIFSPVGLFTSELAGLNTESFLKGAAQVYDYCEKTSPEKNAFSILTQELIRLSGSHPIHVLMPYSTRLRLIGDWFVQLWGESLGKNGRGFTPIGAVGATDQHSILQLLRDGPNDKMVWFVTIDSIEKECPIPQGPLSPSRGRYASFELLQGHTLHELLMIEYRATSLVLSKAQRPQLTFQLDQLDERAIGALFFSWSILTALAGVYWGINPFDQPGVEEGKVYTRDALLRSASDPQKEDFENSAVERLRRHRD